GDFEWTAMVYNLNTGKNDELLEKCRPLKEYMIFINKVREYSDDKGVDIKTAITNAIDYCIEENIMREFLIKHKAEVFSVCITEFDEKIYEAELREEAREEGREEERIKNIRKTIFLLHRLNFKTEDIIREISQTFEIPLETAGKYIEDYYNELSKKN
ncbi:MAG: hypothetical protein IIV51_01895, partial [Lachnospiraceae bacterium]|nr:hypothetical protein [Lachnospiraceae bacterium]